MVKLACGIEAVHMCFNGTAIWDVRPSVDTGGLRVLIFSWHIPAA